MVFNIYRVSDFEAETAPCKNAVREREGFNDWIIEINTLEELMELEQEVGKIILRSNSICIYDDYVE